MKILVQPIIPSLIPPIIKPTEESCCPVTGGGGGTGCGLLDPCPSRYGGYIAPGGSCI